MNATKIFMMAALALMTAACSNDDNDLAQQPAEQPANGEITITATLDADDGAMTRALSIDGSNIASTWETTDEFAILFNDGSADVKRMATVSSINGSNVTITFTIPEALANNTACTIVYPASAANAANTGADVDAALATQGGTIATTPEVRVGTATIDKTNHSLSSVTKLAAQNAIFKFTTNNADGSATIDVTSLTVSIGTHKYVITPTSATSTLYAALPAVSSQAVGFAVTGSNSKTYVCSKANVTFAAGKYFQSPLKMAQPKALSAVTSADVGKVIGADGNIYETVAAANAAGTASGIIAYVGTAGSADASSGTYKGLAISLTDANDGTTCSWYDSYSAATCVTQNSDFYTARDYINGISCTNTLVKNNAGNCNGHSHPAATAARNFGTARPSDASTWFLPSLGQWQLIVQGLAKKAGTASPYYLGDAGNKRDYFTASYLNSVITNVGGTGFQELDSYNNTAAYWSSTEYSGSDGWLYYSSGCGSRVNKWNSKYVRAVFAF